MDDKHVLNLIRYHINRDDEGFIKEVSEIIKELEREEKSTLSEEIRMLLSKEESSPKENPGDSQRYLKIMNPGNEGLLFPNSLQKDLSKVRESIEERKGFRFLFTGDPGTGKTSAAEKIASLLDRKIFTADFSGITDKIPEKLPDTAAFLQGETASFEKEEKCVILCKNVKMPTEEKTDASLWDIPGNVPKNAVLIMTADSCTEKTGKNFDAVVDFNRYSCDNLLNIAERVFKNSLQPMKAERRHIRLLRKIIHLRWQSLNPGEIKRIIQTALSYSNPEKNTDYFRRIYIQTLHKAPDSLWNLKEQGFSVREMEILTGISKSCVARELQKP